MKEPFFCITNLKTGHHHITQQLLNEIPVNDFCEILNMILEQHEWDDRDCVCSIKMVDLITGKILEGDAE